MWINEVYAAGFLPMGPLSSWSFAAMHCWKTPTPHCRMSAPISAGICSSPSYQSTGIEEAGIDQGGLTKEFLEEVVYASFDLERGLMAQTEGGLGFPHAAAGTLGGALSQLRLLGLLLGKALLEGILLDVPLAHFFITFLQVGATLQGLLPLGP